MKIDRRHFIAGLAAAPVLAAGRAAQAAPALSANNFGLTYAKAVRGNGWIEIDAAGFERNIAELRQLIGPQIRICAVMKADAYGHGLDLLMPSILRSRIDCVGITDNEEARIARALHFSGHLVRLRTATLEEVEDGFAYGIEELAGNLAFARDLAVIAAKRGRRLSVHLMLNSTGMSRNGLELSTASGQADAQALVALPQLLLAGIASHFPVEEVADMTPGLARFKQEAEGVVAAGGLARGHLALHVANSFATLNLPEARLDMVRVGGALYGDTDPAFPQFRSIMTFKSRVAAVNAYPAGDTVSYDRTYKLARDSWLANIPIGYSDGYRRGFSHRNQPPPDATQAHVLIRRHKLPVLGRVTMNTLMVDATDFKDEIQIDDEVVLYGRQGEAEITREALETIGGTIGADFYTVWGNSMSKVLAPRH
jgi:amino-acid racemase